MQIPWLHLAQLYPVELYCSLCSFILTLNNQPLFFALGLQIYVVEQIIHAWLHWINQCGLHQLIFWFRGNKSSWCPVFQTIHWHLTARSKCVSWLVQHFLIQAGLILCQEYVPEKCHATRIQISRLRQCFFGGLRDWQSYPVYCMTVPLVDIWTYRLYMCCI